MSPDFLLTALVVCLIPGTGVLYTLATGIGRGLRASVLAAVGCTLGIVPHALASIVGLAALLHASAVAFQAVKVLGVLFLLYMACGVLREGGALSVEGDRRPRSAARLVRDGILLNILNPKLSLFFLAFLPQFVAATSAAPALHLAGLALVFMGLTFAVFLGYGAAAALARSRVVARPRLVAWLRRSVAATFLLLGARLAVAER